MSVSARWNFPFMALQYKNKHVGSTENMCHENKCISLWLSCGRKLLRSIRFPALALVDRMFLPDSL